MATPSADYIVVGSGINGLGCAAILGHPGPGLSGGSGYLLAKSLR